MDCSTAGLPVPSLAPEVCLNSWPLNWWCHDNTLSSVATFSCLQSLPASKSFPISLLFISGGQSFGVSVSASVLPMNNQGLFPLELTGLISVQSRGLSRVFSHDTVQKHQLFGTQPFHGTVLTSVHDCCKIHSFDYMGFVSKVMSLLFNMLPVFVIAFLAVHGVAKSRTWLSEWTELNWTELMRPDAVDLNFLNAGFCQLLHRYKHSIECYSLPVFALQY